MRGHLTDVRRTVGGATQALDWPRETDTTMGVAAAVPSPAPPLRYLSDLPYLFDSLPII